MRSINQTPAIVKRYGSQSHCYNYYKLPSVLNDHHARKSVIDLFTHWVNLSDQQGNGIVCIRLREQSYSHKTTSYAIKWLTARKLLLRTERGLGRGNGSRYLVRWSFNHPSIGSRQTSLNHIETMISATHNNRGESKAVQYTKKSCKNKTQINNYHPLLQKTLQTSQKNFKFPQLIQKSSKTFRWGLARIREAATKTLSYKPREKLISAFAITLSRAIEKHKLKPGQAWGKLVATITNDIQEIVEETFWPLENDSLQEFCSFAGHVVKECLDFVTIEQCLEYRSTQAYRTIREEKRQLTPDPVMEFLETENVGSLRDAIKARVRQSEEYKNYLGGLDGIRDRSLRRRKGALNYG